MGLLGSLYPSEGDQCCLCYLLCSSCLLLCWCWQQLSAGLWRCQAGAGLAPLGAVQKSAASL